MGLIACKECHAQISANAKACPQCGAPIERRGCFSTLIRGAVLIGLLLFLVHLVTREPALDDDGLVALHALLAAADGAHRSVLREP